MSIIGGALYIVATPLGNLEDMSPRAVATLSGVDLIAAEDTRHSAPLLRHFGIATRCVALHEHNERRAIGTLLDRLARGKPVALISDAGTPLISDPGYHLVREARRRGIRVIPVPGPGAVLAALSVAGLPTDRFVFEGFLPARAAARRERMAALRDEARTLVFFESTHRVLDCLRDMAQILGPEREAVVARELTKLYETVRGGPLAELCVWMESDPMQQKGEFVLLVHGAVSAPEEKELREARRVLALLLEDMPPKQAVTLAAKITGAKRNALYRIAVEVAGGE